MHCTICGIYDLCSQCCPESSESPGASQSNPIVLTSVPQSVPSSSVSSSSVSVPQSVQSVPSVPQSVPQSVPSVPSVSQSVPQSVPSHFSFPVGKTVVFEVVGPNMFKVVGKTQNL